MLGEMLSVLDMSLHRRPVYSFMVKMFIFFALFLPVSGEYFLVTFLDITPSLTGDRSDNVYMHLVKILLGYNLIQDTKNNQMYTGSCCLKRRWLQPLNSQDLNSRSSVNKMNA